MDRGHEFAEVTTGLFSDEKLELLGAQLELSGVLTAIRDEISREGGVSTYPAGSWSGPGEDIYDREYYSFATGLLEGAEGDADSLARRIGVSELVHTVTGHRATRIRADYLMATGRVPIFEIYLQNGTARMADHCEGDGKLAGVSGARLTEATVEVAQAFDQRVHTPNAGSLDETGTELRKYALLDTEPVRYASAQDELANNVEAIFELMPKRRVLVATDLYGDEKMSAVSVMSGEITTEPVSFQDFLYCAELRIDSGFDIETGREFAVTITRHLDALDGTHRQDEDILLLRSGIVSVITKSQRGLVERELGTEEIIDHINAISKIYELQDVG